MDMTTLAVFLKSGELIQLPEGWMITIPPQWVVEDEDRISYTTLIRVVECCREQHWNADIVPLCNKAALDSICASLTCNFYKAIPVGTAILVKQQVVHIGRKSYTLEFTIIMIDNMDTHAHFSLVSVFYDPVSKRSIDPPELVVEMLRGKLSKEMGEKNA